MIRHAALALLCSFCLGSGPVRAQATLSVASLHEAVDAYRTAPPVEQERRAERAREISHEWLKRYLPAESGDRPRRTVRSAMIVSMARHYRSTGTHGRDIQPDDVMSGAVEDLRKAIRLDPTLLEAHVALTRLYYESGRREQAIGHGEFVREYVEESAGDLCGWDAVAAPWLAYEASVNLAWAYRELGQWEKGLAVVGAAGRLRQALGLDPSHRLALVEGLLLAGAGRGAEAIRLAGDVLPSFWALKYSGYKSVMPYRRVSVYAQEWIQSQVYLQEGDVRLAMPASVRSSLANRDDWTRLPYFRQYWNDVGFLFELRGEPAEAAHRYDQLETARFDWLLFMEPIHVDAARPFIADLPGGQVFHVRSVDHVYLWGSPFSFVASEIQRLTAIPDLDGHDARKARRKTMAVVRSLEARGARPDFCHAARGWIAYLFDDLVTAEAELTTAQSLFAERDLVDAGTRLILGLVKLGLGKDAEAEALLAAAPHDALAVRGLGVIVARRGDFPRALAIMDRALELDPRSAAGWYNRGMLLFENGRFEEAARDFRQAQDLDPDNPYVQSWMGSCEVLVEADAIEAITGQDYLRRGKLFLEAGAYERARADFLEAYRQSPERSGEIAPLLQQVAKAGKSSEPGAPGN